MDGVALMVLCCCVDDRERPVVRVFDICRRVWLGLMIRVCYSFYLLFVIVRCIVGSLDAMRTGALIVDDCVWCVLWSAKM